MTAGFTAAPSSRTIRSSFGGTGGPQYVATAAWWHTIVPPGGKERTGYPTQKPLGILRRIVQTSAPPGGLVADFFAGSGTTGVAAYQANRPFLLVDDHPEATQVMARRFAAMSGIEYEGFAPSRKVKT
jgi:site-specific DNA-methyltransferase (adenine-specific)